MLRREEIKNLEKGQWYTRAHIKALGTITEDHPSLTHLMTVVKDLMSDLNQQPNKRMETQYKFGQKH